MNLVPPHDLDAEAAVLSAVLLEPAAMDTVSLVLAPECFYSEANRRIFEAASDLGEKGSPVDVVTVAGLLRERERLAQCGGAAYLARLVDSVPSVAHVETYAEMVREKWRVRSLIATCQRIAAEGYSDVGDAQTFIDRAEAEIYKIAQRERRKDAAHIEVVLHESYQKMLAAEQRQGEVELPTGLVKLDQKIGGLGRGRVTVVAGRPGMGKTAIATGAAENIASVAGAAAIFSLEMPRAELGMRMACCRAGASVHRGINGWLWDAERVAVLRAKDELRRLPIWIDDTPAISLMELRSRARAIATKAGGRLALIVIDYLQLMRGSSDRRDTRDRELSAITAGLKQLAKELECAVILLSQLNRECENEKDKRPRLSHLRESGGIEQDADDVVFVYRDEYYHAESDDKGIAELIVAKQRNGPTGTVRVGFAGASTAFHDLDERSAAS